jgi:predicted RNase H-like nuclease (RuvC/YqgF family)
MKRTITRLLLVMLLAAATLGGAAASQHEGEAVVQPKEWDQAAVAGLAEKLQHSFDALRADARNRPPDNLGSGQSEYIERYQDILRSLEDECRRLKREVEDGKGRADTLKTFERIDELRRDADEDARRLFLAKATIDKIQANRAELEQLRLYYTGKVDETPSLVGPSKGE